MPVPAKLQAALFAKILTFDRELKVRENNRLVIGIVYQEQVRASSKAKEAFMKALTELNGNQIFVFHCMPINIGTETELTEQIAQCDVDVIYIAPIRAIDIRIISQLSQKLQKLTLTGVPKYVKQGLAAGIDIHAGKPQILINLPAARAQGANFRSQLLKMTTVIQ